MTPEERELRRALDSRSEEVSPEFRARLSSALAEGKPSSNFLPALAAVAAVVLVFATVGVLLLARQARHQPPPVAATTPTANATPTPSPLATPSLAPAVAGVLTKPPRPIALPANAQLSAPSSNVLWVLMVDQYLYRSTDRGATWTQRPLPPSHQGYPQPEITFVSGSEGWLNASIGPVSQCVGEKVAIWHTTDAGTTWQLLRPTGIGSTQCENGLSFVDSSHGFLDAWDPSHRTVIYRTSDGGQTWAASVPLPYPPDYKPAQGGVSMQAGPVRAYGSTLLVTAAGLQFTQYIFRSTDGGATWAYLANAPYRDSNVDFVTASRWLQLIGPGQSVETTDAGASWHRYAPAYSQAAPIAADFVFADSKVGYGTVRGEITRTVDGGLHWVQIKSPGT